MLITCPHCSTRNRVAAERLAEKPVCGRCSKELLAGAPVALQDRQRALQQQRRRVADMELVRTLYVAMTRAERYLSQPELTTILTAQAAQAAFVGDRLMLGR